MTDDDRDGWEEWQHKLHDHVLADLEAPRDVVPRGKPSPEAVAALLEANGREVQLTLPGEVILDADGIPTGMTEPTTHSAVLMVSRSLLGLEEETDDE